MEISFLHSFSNEFILFLIHFGLLLCVFYDYGEDLESLLRILRNFMKNVIEDCQKYSEELTEVLTTSSETESGMQSRSNYHHKNSILHSFGREIYVPLPPIHTGCKLRTMAYLDLVYLASFMPANAIINTNDQQEKLASLQLKVSPERNSVDYSSVSHSIRLSSSSKSPLQSPQKHTQSKRTSSVDADKYSIEALKLKGKLEIPPGCEPDSQTAEDLAKEFQSLTRVDVVRFLIARKGSYDLAKAMIIKERAWRNQTFPIKQEDLEPVMKTGCFFNYGYAKNGSPCVYMRGGLYNNKAATPRQYALAAAHFIDHAIEKSRVRPLKEGGDGTAQVNVTVIVHSSAVEGVENSTGADMDFIKLFTQVLSDNYPERLRNLIIFPFPW